MSVRSDGGQEDCGAGEVDLQEAKMSLPRLVRRQTPNIPPEEGTSDDLSIPSIPSDVLSIYLDGNPYQSIQNPLSIPTFCLILPPVAIPRESSWR